MNPHGHCSGKIWQVAVVLFLIASSASARFISEDPLGLAGGMNGYGYVEGSPVGFVDPTGLVKWSGSYHARAFIEAVGAGVVEMVLISDCVGGKRYRAHATGVGPGVGVGVPKVPLIASETYGTFMVDDHRSSIDPDVLSGGFAWLSMGVSIGKRDASFGRVRVGKAFGSNPSHGSGLDVGATVLLGTSTVTRGFWESCACEPE